MSAKVMIAANAAWNLVNYRSGLIKALMAQGYEVIAVAPYNKYAAQLQMMGCRYTPLSMDNMGTHPERDLLLLTRFLALLHTQKPDVFLGYTPKCNIYGSLASHVMGVEVINNIAGLGAVFVTNNWLTKLVRGLYRVALSRSNKVFFQNDDDRQLSSRPSTLTWRRRA